MYNKLILNEFTIFILQIYNIEAEANGHFIKIPDDQVTIKIGYYDFIKNQNGTVSKVNVRGWYNFEPSLGLTKFTNTENITEYEYDLTKDLDRMNLSTVLHRMLKLDVNFALHSIRVDWDSQNTRCLRINGTVSFNNLNNNGQVVIKLTTLTYPVTCDFSTNG
ncbi:uncharacterized protein LOC132750956 [Ruditapes philippinarum]|uniref:uncharacterized protein LOC132750956 n=1 Tax=Ruditapes philippinarum TaxID=129788 RepID=UPI00295B9ACA|nr:uncharacterized protein LOC132750956 [Ruditapes philippinarum]